MIFSHFHSILQNNMPDDQDYLPGVSCDTGLRERCKASRWPPLMRSVQQEETLILAIRVDLALPPDSCMAGNGALVCMDLVVLSVPWSDNS